MRFDIIVNSMVYDCYKEKKVKVLRDGKQRRPFVHINDVANSYLFFMNYGKQEEINGEIYNVGDEKNNINIIDLAKLIMKELKVKENIEWFGDNPDDRSYFVSYDKIKSIGFEAKYTIRDGINDVYSNLVNGKLEKTEDTTSIAWFNKLEHWKKIIDSKTMYDGMLEIK
jgi:nucleoside-diphosphate-sugar epimerase